MTETYDPYANGTVERVNVILKQEFVIEQSTNDRRVDKRQCEKI